ncbi:MAG: hypothetical protein LBF13_05685, partial [Campylobacteraceae bacterium]|nr:hypothetical protein [Campylobacteraceae bacterium]
MRQKFLLFIALVFIAAAGIFTAFGDKIYSYFERDITFKDMLLECDLHTNFCEVVFEDEKNIRLDISRPIRAGEEMTFNVKTEGFEDDELLVQIYGLNMNMGVFEYVLKKTDNKNYKGKALVPTCMMGKMIWKINIISVRENVGASFVLEL